MSDTDTSISTYVGVIVIFIVLICLVAWGWFKLNKDYKIYLRNKANLVTSSAMVPVPGTDGTDGLDAYQVYLADPGNAPFLSEPDFILSFTGVDGMNGIHAGPAVNGSNGSDGSAGDIGLAGANGGLGIDGTVGETGLEGDSFITFQEADWASAPTPSFLIPTGSSAPDDYPSCAFVSYPSATSGTIKYFFKKSLLTTITAVWAPGTSVGYLSYIIYDEDFRILGLTEPLTLLDYNPNMDVTTTIAETQTLQYRAIISLNRGLVLSSFTSSIIEKTLALNDFTFTKESESDPFIQKFYDLIQATPALEVDPLEFFEKIKISAIGTSSGFDINLSV